MEDSNVIKKGMLTGILSAIIMAFYFLYLSKTGNNDLMLHNLGKGILVVIPVFLLFKNHFHKHGKLKLADSFKLGGVFAVSAAVILVVSELILHNLFSIALTPEEFLHSEINQFALYFLLTLEIFGYSLLSLFLGFQFYKNRMEKKFA